ncbi:MAG TPA: DUF2264 domain-containing protein [Chloroflexia bacterium]|nr:DUF2264 domain-containing protein [Chloroflexia bacterium]
MTNPLISNPLKSRDDFQKAVVELWEPLKPYYSPGRARVTLGQTGHNFSVTASQLEGFARPLWGLIPLAKGAGDFSHWDYFLEGISNGTNPAHPDYWGAPQPRDQRLVEMAAFGLALALIPEKVWESLSESDQANLVNWLSTINQVEIVDSNWLFFRVLVNLGLKKIGRVYDEQSMYAALDRLEEFYLDNGWYSDGSVPQIDYYIPFAFHYYGLIYSSLAFKDDPDRAARFKQRASLFARDFIYWFQTDGAALPFGRSLTYRFSQGAFWGALAFAGVEALPWGVIKGLALRHLRWWSSQPIFNNDGTLSIGYTYPNLNMAEQYNSACSPYWAMKFFLPLALPEDHPFWQAEELPLPDLLAVKPQPEPGMILCSDNGRKHVFALSGKQYHHWARHGEAKYAKFAYSTEFGFSVPGSGYGLNDVGYDSMLALSEDGRHYRVREEVTESRIEGEILYSRWQPWADVEIETWLTPLLPWHIRLHRIKTGRSLHSAESGFSVGLPSEVPIGSQLGLSKGAGFAVAGYEHGLSGVYDLEVSAAGKRQGEITFPHPNTNLVYSRTSLPVLLQRYEPGEHWIGVAVLGLPSSAANNAIWETRPKLEEISPGNFRLRLGDTVKDIYLEAFIS